MRPDQNITRIAPTPSGWLHIGNLCSFLLTRLWADYSKSQLLLRIDDLDTERTREIFVEDIFAQLKWARIQWELGPKKPEDHELHYSQQWCFEFYQAVLDEKRRTFPTYFFVCDCSRKLKSSGQNCSCRTRSLKLETGNSALMLDLRVLAGQTVGVLDFNGKMTQVPFEYAAEEVPLIRREGIFAYHWVSLNEDRNSKVNFIVRGRDLWESTVLQLGIEKMLFPNDPWFSKVGFLHHDLLKGPDGQKLSKSEASQSVLELRNHGFTLEHLYRVFADFIGMADRDVSSLDEIRDFLNSRWNHDQQGI
jgi:glutamyl/glutaminyl-tRNA synthetase